jgi:hypothetical protein
MMDHRQYIEQYLSADVDGALSPAERQEVSAHLAGCADCRQLQDEERGLKLILRERIPITPAPADLRRKIIAAMDREDVQEVAHLPRFSRRPLWIGSAAALAIAAAILVIILIGGLGQPTNSSFDAAVRDYLNSEQKFTSNPQLNSLPELASELVADFGYPYIWDFSPMGLSLAGARSEHLASGATVVYSLFRGKAGSILCINFRRLDFNLPAGGQEFHGVRFYRYKDVWIGVVNYGTVFCYMVTRMTPEQMAPALIRGAPKTGTS